MTGRTYLDRMEDAAPAAGAPAPKTPTDELPQLRVRTEFSFRRTFAPLERVGARLDAMGAPAAGIVDGGTWGHVRWAQQAAKRAYLPLFGTELTVPQPNGFKPTAWALARDTAAFYRFSTAARRPDADVPALMEEYAAGLVRFAGAALDDPATFDFIDVNPSSPLLVRRALRLAERTGKPLVLTSDNAYPAPEDYNAFMAICGQDRVTPQHLLTLEELRAALPQLSGNDFDEAVRNTRAVPALCATELRKAPMIHMDGDLRALAYAGRDRRLAAGHLKEWTPEYEQRLERELKVIAEKDFESYFLVVADLVNWAKQHMLVGPGRGSSAGSLLCYLIGITEVDPIPHHLLFERFIDVTRDDLPDIDIDFSDTKRDKVFRYLEEKYGSENVARLGNISSLQPRSALAEVCKRLRVPDSDRFDLLNVLIEYSSGDSRYGHSLEDTLTQTETGKKFMEKHPAAMIVREVERHAWHTSVHAAGVAVCNVPVIEYCTVGADGVAQIDKVDAEYLNLLKIDALGLRTLGVIEDAGVVTADELYALELEDPEVLRIFDEKKFCGIFQFEGHAQRSVSAQVAADSFRTLDHVTALARPGPLGGGAANKYIMRKAGREEVTFTHPALEATLADTYGVVLYQEQVMRIVREVGKFSWADTTVIRKGMSGRRGQEFFDRQVGKFIEGAARDGIDEATARAIWQEICTFGAWGMNRAHTCAYAMISYWCAYMKRYHPLEYAAACLRSAKDDEQTLEILRELSAEGVEYVPFDPELSDVNWTAHGTYGVDGRIVGGFMNLRGFGPAKSRDAVAARERGGFPPKMWERIQAAEVKFADLYPLHTAYGHIYRNPESVGCRPGSRVVEVKSLPESGDVLMIGRVVKKELRDENETVRLQRRNGRRLNGPTLFADIFVSDDSGGPVTIRIDRWMFDPMGREAMEHLIPNEDVLLIRGRRIPNFNMVKAQRLRCLTRPEVKL